MEENKIIKINELAQQILDSPNYGEKVKVLRQLFKKYIKKQNKNNTKCRDPSHREFFRERYENHRREKLYLNKFYDMSH